MMSDNVFESLAAQERQRVAGTPTLATDSTFDLLADQERKRQQAMAAQLARAVAVNPDTYNTQRKAAESLGLPAFAAEVNPNITQHAQAQKIQRDVASYPVLQKAYGAEDFARLAHDDSAPLANVNRTLAGTARDIGTVALKSAVGLPQALVGLADLSLALSPASIAIKAMRGEPLLGGGYIGKGLEAVGIDFKRTQEILSGKEGETLLSYSAAQQAANQRVADVDGFTQTLSTMLENPSTIATMVGESLPQMLGGAAIGRAALSLGARAVGAGMVGPNLPGLMVRQFGEKTAALLASAFGEGTIAAGATAEQLRSENADGLIGAKETLAALGTGAGTALFGFAGGFGSRKLGIGDIDTALVSRGLNAEAAETLKKGFVSSIVRSGISEGLFEELPQSIQEQVWQNWANDRPLDQGVGKAAAQGAIAGFAMGGGFQAIGRVRDHYSEINTAQTGSQQLLDAINAAAPSALRERNPEQFRATVQAMADNAEGAPSEIYVDAEVLNQLAPEVLAQLPQSVRDQIPDALAANDVVSISTGDVLTIAPGTPLEQVLVENGRVGDPRAMTQLEANQAAEKAQEFLAQQAQQVIQQAADQQAVQQSHDAVKQTLLDQLNAVGRDRPAVNQNTATLYASLYTTLAGELGITPEAAFALHGVNVVGQTGQGGVLNKLGMKPGAVTVEGFHYSKESRPQIDTAMFGTGLQGSNRDQYLTATDKRLRKRAYFYVDKGTGINPEAGVGGIAQKAQLTNVYDADADPLRLKKGGQLAFESAVLDAGFSGYLTRMEGTQSGQVIMLGDQKIPTQAIGPATKLQGQVVPAPQARESKGRDAIVDALNAAKALPSGSPTRARWSEILRAQLPEVHAALEAAGLFAGNANENLYKSDLVKAFEAATPAENYEQRAERPVSAAVSAAADVGNARVIAASRQWPSNRDFKMAIQAAVRAVTGTRDLRQDTPENRAYVGRQMLKEAREALVTNSNAIGWYDEKVTIALAVASVVHPELSTDEQSRFAFTWALAVTSNGVKVDKNFEMANRAYGQWKASNADPAKRTMPTAGIGIGPTASKIHEALATYNNLSARWGYDKFKAFATTLQPNRQVKADFGRGVSGEGMDTLVYGAGVVGPKIGNGFFMNLYGEFGQLTMDRWWVRMWGRITGDLVEVDRDKIKASRDSFVSLIEMVKADKAATRAVEQAIGTRLGKGNPVEMAKAIIKATAAEDVRRTLDAVLPATPEREAAAAAARGKLKDFVSIGDELRKAAKSYYGNLDGQIEVPGGSRRRDMMRAVSQDVLAELQKEHPSLTMADFQALMWYPEKTLYDSAGAQEQDSEGYNDDEAPDYANAAVALARQQGVSDDEINAAIERARSDIEARRLARGSGRAAPGVQSPGGDGAGGDSGTAGTFSQTGGINGRPEQAGDRGGRYSSGSLAPLEGAPNVAGASGPDPRIVAVAEQYARDNGIPLQRQGEYARVDPERAARIAAAYDTMVHAPQDPAVREAYENLIQQTLAQYRALEAAGYRFFLVDESNDPYGGNPWNAMRDLRANQAMGVFATEAGFGSGATELNVDDNPLLADTGLRWPYGSLEGEPKRVLANDLFRAVHDAFGHGLEGAGFRAQGEENAWQAHIRLFTGSAQGAITSETRGQNSWLNYGPHGATNQTAKVEDTIFADQKTGLMPAWTWAEGVVPDMPAETLQQGPRGTFNPATFELALNENSNMSTVHHEMAHAYLEIITKIASEPNAPQGIVDQVDRFLKWQGIPDLATWNMMTLDQKRPHHEAMAENYEHYLITGKAPSVELQPLFRKFKLYMLNAYKTLKSFFEQNPDVDKKLPPEMVQFYDRMLASEEQIAQANEVAGLLPDLDADAEAVEKLTARSLRDLKWAVNARNKEIKRLQDQAKELRKEVEEQVTAEVNEMPEFQAKAALDALQVTPDYTVALNAWKEQRAAALTTAAEQIKADLLAANPDVKGLKKAQLLAKNKRLMANQAEAKALEWEAQNPKPTKAQNATDADLAVVADSFGYPDAETMLQAIDAIGKKSDVIAGMTDQRMLEEHGDLIDQRAIEQAANEAVHNEARARSLATELKSQGEMLNARTDTGQTNAAGSKITVNALLEAAKQFAANVVGRTPIKDLQSKARQHTAAERRAGKRWQDHTTKGETADAVKAKQDQMLNNAAAKAALEAQAEMRKILEFFKRVYKDGNEKTVEKGRDPDVVNAARAILGAYGVAPKGSKTALEYLALVEKNDPAMYAALQPSVQGALNLAQPLEALTMDELRALNEEIQRMWHLAKRSRQMEVDGNLIDIQEAEDELQGRMQVLGVPTEMPGESGALTPREELARKLQFAGSILRRVEQWADGMGKEFTRLVFQPVKEAADRYRADRVKYRKAYKALIDTVAPSLVKGQIVATELGYTFGKGHNGIGHAELLHAILHTGNESNKRKLLLGRGWATENADGTMDTSKWDAFIKRMHDTGVLNKAHYDFAQGVWNLLEQTKPLAQKTHRDVFGRYFAEVTAESFITPFGTYAGGYVPAQADPRIVQDAALRDLATTENENMSFSFPGTNKGFTKGRVEYNRPLMLDLRTIGQHIDKVLLFSHMEPAVRDVNKLLSRKGVSYSLGRIDPTIYAGMLTPWLNRSARQIVETPIVGDGGISRVLSAARSRAGMALMFANVSNTLQQLTGFSLAALKVKPASMMRATAQFIASPKQTARAVSDASAFMANRMENEISAINDAMDQIMLDPNLYQKAQAWTQKHAYFLQTAMANTMEPIIWTAAYNDALAEGQSEKDAVRQADGVIRTTQGSTLPEDVSRIETGPAYARVFTQFIGYFNMMANTNATALKQIAQEEGLKKGAGKALGVVTLGFLVPIWVAEAIAHAMRGGPEDKDDDGYLDDWLAAVFGMGTIKGSLAMVPFVGQLANAGIARFNSNPADDKMSLSPAVSLLESAVGVPVDVYRAITDPEKLNMRNAVRDVASAVSIATGLPAVAIARPLGYLAGVEQGKIEPTSAVDMARGLITGTPSPTSK